MIGEASDCARSLRSREAVALRKAMLRDPHIARFTCFVAKLEKAHPDWEFPNFDPLDGGANADMLFLFEKPGRMTSAGGKGSGFISEVPEVFGTMAAELVSLKCDVLVALGQLRRT